MKSLAPLAGFSFALILAGLGSGCASSTPAASYHQPAQDFEVVETSAKRPLSDTEMSEVRSSVASYLDREGATDSGDYYLKVYLTPENVDAEPEWVVVRFTRYTTQRVALVSAYAYDGLAYSPYSSYYAYDIYPYGYGCVSRISFQYYVDPFYHQHYPYYPRHGHKGGHKGDHDHNDANNHGGKPGNPPGHGGAPGRPSGPKYTENHPATPPSRSRPPASGPRDAEYPRRYAPRTNPGGSNPGTDVAQGGNRDERRPDATNGSNPGRRPGVTPPPRTTPARGDADSRPQNYASANPPPSTQQPSTQTQHRRNRPDGAPASNRIQNPTRVEARVEPPANRPSQGHRPAQQQQSQQQPQQPRNYQPASRPALTSQPARTYQPPARTYQPPQSSSQPSRPSYQPAPERSSSAPASSSSSSDSRPSDRGSQRHDDAR